MTKEMEKYIPFVASLTYGIDEEDEGPMTVKDAQYTMDQWEEEGSIEVPEGFTAEIFSAIWSEWYPEKQVQDEEPKMPEKHLIINDTDFGEVSTYYQDRDDMKWCFALENEIEIRIPFNIIKLFTSNGDLEIITNGGK